MSFLRSEYDIIIVGAGPAGCTAALHLAKQNKQVLLIEAEKFPRDKICGDALSGNVGYELFKLGEEALQSFSEFPEKQHTQGIQFISPGGKSLEIRLTKIRKGLQAPGFISTRMNFDHFLFESVKKSNRIEVVENCKYLSHRIESNAIIVKTEKGEIYSKIVIGANGAHSSFFKYAENQVDKRHHAAGLRQYYEGVEGFAEGDLIELHFLKEILPGYFWIFPLPNGMANVGIGIRSDVVAKKKLNLKKIIAEIIANHPKIAPRFKNAKALESVKGFGLPLGSRKVNMSGERFILIGDAASLIDPFTGEGIGNAMTSGRLAADFCAQIFEENDFSAKNLKRFDDLVYNKLKGELQISYLLQKLLFVPGLFDFVVKKASKNKHLAQLIADMIEDPGKRIAWYNPLFYLKLLR